MSSINEFHVGGSSVEQRAATDVFKSSAQPAEDSIKSRFASSGKFTSEQLEAGQDLEEQAPTEEGAFDPDDKRSLYERLQAHKDAKEEEFQHKSAFKNQMDHWRLDDDDAAFEEERRQKQMQQQQEATRLHEEGAQFYKLARASQETVRKPALMPAAPSAWELGRGRGEKRKPPSKPAPAFKVLKVQPNQPAAAPAASPVTAAASTAPPPLGTTERQGSAVVEGKAAAMVPDSGSGGGGLLPGMDMYSDDDDDDDDDGGA